MSPQAWQNIENPFTEIALLQRAGISVWNPVSIGEDTLFFVLATVAGLLALATPPLAVPLETLAMGSFLVLSLFSRHLVLFFAAVAMPPASRTLTALVEKIRRGGVLCLARSRAPPPRSPWALYSYFRMR